MFTSRPDDPATDPLEVALLAAPDVSPLAEHVHPRQDETFAVVPGTIEISRNGVETRPPGDDLRHLTTPPLRVQTVVFVALAPVERALGYRANPVDEAFASCRQAAAGRDRRVPVRAVRASGQRRCVCRACRGR